MTRRIIVLLVACALVAGNLLVAGAALGDQALFRVQRSFLNLPNPAITTPGNAGMAIDALAPPTIYKATYNAPQYYQGPQVAEVQPGNPVGSAFTLPAGFIAYVGTYTINASTGWSGYTTISMLNSYNNYGRFGPQHTHTASTPIRIVFPTTGGNTASPSNYGLGNPALQCPGTPSLYNCGTNAYGGRYDFSRQGSINVTPGPNQFGGSFRIFYDDSSSWYQNIYYWSPVLYKAYGDFFCKDATNYGRDSFADCTVSGTSRIGNVTQYGSLPRYLLNVVGTGTGAQTGTGTAKATRSILSSTHPTTGGLKSYVKKGNKYFQLIHPWTTGYAIIDNPGIFTTRATPRRSGYDTDLGGVSLTVTETNWNQYYNYTAQTVATNTTSMKSYLQNVGRVVSLVQPRLTAGYNGPLDPTTGAVIQAWSVARMRMMKVFFLPEPTGMLLLGTGIATLLGLYLMRRR